MLMIQITKLLADGRNYFSFLCKGSHHCFPKLGNDCQIQVDWLSDPCGPTVSWSYRNRQAAGSNWQIGHLDWSSYPSGLIVRPKWSTNELIICILTIRAQPWLISPIIEAQCGSPVYLWVPTTVGQILSDFQIHSKPSKSPFVCSYVIALLRMMNIYLVCLTFRAMHTPSSINRWSWFFWLSDPCIELAL